MSATDRDEIIEQLRVMIAGRGDGIHLDTPFHWAVNGLKHPVPFFEHLPSLLPSKSVAYVEGTRIAPDMAVAPDGLFRTGTSWPAGTSRFHRREDARLVRWDPSNRNLTKANRHE